MNTVLPGNWAVGLGLVDDATLTLRIARASDRARLVQVINAVCGERRYLQTDHYVPTPLWEQALKEGLNTRAGVLLTVVECASQVVGFGRVFCEGERGWEDRTGNVGLALLPRYRSRGIGTRVLGCLIDAAPWLGFQKLTADILVCNVRSRRLFARYLFQTECVREIWLPDRRAHVGEMRVALDLKRRSKNDHDDFALVY